MAIKIFFLKFLVMWRRFRRGSDQNQLQDQSHNLQYGSQVASLMALANPFASWNQRANWMVDLAEWIRRQPKVSLLDESAWRRVKQQRVAFVLEWLAEHRQVRRVVQATLQKTLREALGPELFCATGLPREQSFIGELWEHVLTELLPRPPAHRDLSRLFTTMFPDPADAEWLRDLDGDTLAQLWKLCADEDITHNFHRQVDEALLYLVTMIVATGIGPDFKQRLDPHMPLQVTPFMALRRELENYLMAQGDSAQALRSVRMLIAVCQAQTDRVYAHLDRHGVSVSLVFHTERMRAQLKRMTGLIELRASAKSLVHTGAVPALLADLILANHRRSTLRGLVGRSVSLLARKIVERKVDTGEQTVARDRGEYLSVVKAAGVGGILLALILAGKLALHQAGFAEFFEGLFASLNYALGFLTIAALGGILAGRQPAGTAPLLASKMHALDSVDSLHALLREVAALLRTQAAAVFGNLMTVVPVVLIFSLAVGVLLGAPLLAPEKAQRALHEISVAGPTPLLAALTGVLLWFASLVAGFADNWFALRGLRQALGHHRRLIYVLGAQRTERLARWLERQVAAIAGSLTLAFLFGMTPVLAHFFGVPFDVRHVSLAAASLTAAASGLGWQVLATSGFWLAVAGVVVSAVLNVGLAFGCALGLAMQAREVPGRLRRAAWRAILRKLLASPRSYLFPQVPDGAELPEAETASAADPSPAQRRREARKSLRARQ
ncbi:site-specific recombinase [soil metagenome]